MDADGSHQHRLTTSPAGQLIEFLSWSPEGQTILFVSQSIENSSRAEEALVTIDVGGKNKRVLATNVAPGSRPQVRPPN
jgi:Tol biopolymer transport system component